MTLKITKLEKYRPALHFSPKKNWMNDPNGLVFFKGEYHLFYQHNPHGSTWGPMHWGHAVSKDLIVWEELEIALHPDENGTIFSGSIVVDWNNTTGFFNDEPGLVAIFTHHLEPVHGKEAVQTQSLAYSLDKGRSWIKYDGNPVLAPPSKPDFRDPKVFWHKESQKWMMALATGQTISFYSAPNLKDWKFESEFGENCGCHEGVWECPDLFELPIDNSNDKKWVLIVSIGDNPQYDEGSRTQYFVGSFDGKEFMPEHEEIKWLDYGKDNYAGVSFSDIPEADGRRIYLGWMSNWRYANQVPTEGWRSQMTLPRVLELREEKGEYYLVQHLVRELDTYFERKEERTDTIITAKESTVFEVDDEYTEIILSLKNINANKYGLKIEHTDLQHTTITIDVNENVLSLSREKSGIVDFSDNFPKLQRVYLEDSQSLDLRIIVDSASLELFINGGEQALTSLIFPDKVSKRVCLFAKDGEVNLVYGKVSVPSKN